MQVGVLDRAWIFTPQLLKLTGRIIVYAGDIDQVAVVAPDYPEDRTAQDAGVADDRVEHGLDIGRRARDHAKDLARRRLLLQRLREVAVARLQLREQPRVLDGDDGLVGEGLE